MAEQNCSTRHKVGWGRGFFLLAWANGVTSGLGTQQAGRHVRHTVNVTGVGQVNNVSTPSFSFSSRSWQIHSSIQSH